MYSHIVNKRGCSKTRASRCITGGGFMVAFGVFLAMGVATTSFMGTFLQSAALAALAFARGGWSMNHAEIAAPEHGSMLYSVAQCISSVTSVVGISVTGKLLDAFGGAQDPAAWTAAMGMVGALCGVCGLYYMATAGGDHVLFPANCEGEQGDGRGGGGGGDVFCSAVTCAGGVGGDSKEMVADSVPTRVVREDGGASCFEESCSHSGGGSDDSGSRGGGGSGSGSDRGVERERRWTLDHEWGS